MSAKTFRPGNVAKLLMQHRTSLYAYIFSCVRNHADTEDILQNVSVAVIESTTVSAFRLSCCEVRRARLVPVMTIVSFPVEDALEAVSVC